MKHIDELLVSCKEALDPIEYAKKLNKEYQKAGTSIKGNITLIDKDRIDRDLKLLSGNRKPLDMSNPKDRNLEGVK